MHAFIRYASALHIAHHIRVHIGQHSLVIQLRALQIAVEQLHLQSRHFLVRAGALIHSLQAGAIQLCFLQHLCRIVGPSLIRRIACRLDGVVNCVNITLVAIQVVFSQLYFGITRLFGGNLQAQLGLFHIQARERQRARVALDRVR